MLLYVDLYSEKDADIDEKFLYNYAYTRIVPELQRINGIAQAKFWVLENTLCVFGLSLIGCGPTIFRLRKYWKLWTSKALLLALVDWDKVQVFKRSHFGICAQLQRSI
jgi:hypothetical protein